MSNEDKFFFDKIAMNPDKEFKVFGRDILAFKQQLDAQKAELDKLHANLADLVSERRKLDTGLQVERSRSEELEKQIATLQGDYKSRDLKVHSMEDEVASKLKKMENEMAAKIKEMQDKIQDLESREQELIKEREAVIVERDAKIAAVQDERDILVAKLSEMQKMVPKAEPVPDIDDQAMVRACMTCKEYMLVDEGNYKNTRAMILFDTAHRGHMLGTLTHGEVKGGFLPKTRAYLEKVK